MHGQKDIKKEELDFFTVFYEYISWSVQRDQVGSPRGIKLVPITRTPPAFEFFSSRSFASVHSTQHEGGGGDCKSGFCEWGRRKDVISRKFTCNMLLISVLSGVGMSKFRIWCVITDLWRSVHVLATAVWLRGCNSTSCTLKMYILHWRAFDVVTSVHEKDVRIGPIRTRIWHKPANLLRTSLEGRLVDCYWWRSELMANA
jgi:hypothetical protein